MISKFCNLLVVFQLLLVTIPVVKCQDPNEELVGSLRGEIEQLRRELGESRSIAEKFKNDFETERNNLFGWRDRSNNMESSLQAETERLRNSIADLERANQELGVERETTQSLRSQMEGQVREVQLAQERMQQMEAKSREIEEKNRELELFIESNRNEMSAKLEESAKSNVAELEKALVENRDLRASVESLQNELNTKTESNKETAAELAAHAEKASKLANVESELARAKEQINELSKAAEKKDSQVANVESELSRAKEQINELNKSKKQTANILEETKSQVKTSKDTLFQVRRELTQTKEELSEYKDQEAFWSKVWNLLTNEINDFGERLYDIAEPIVGDLRPYFKQAYYQIETGVSAAMSLVSSAFNEVMVAAPGLWQKAGGDVVTDQIVDGLEKVDYFIYHDQLVQSMQKTADTALSYVKIEKAPKYVTYVVEKWQSNCEGVSVFLELYFVIVLLVLLYTAISGIIGYATKSKPKESKPQKSKSQKTKSNKSKKE